MKREADAVIDMGTQPTDPVTVNGQPTPFQHAGTTFCRVIAWLHGEGGAPGTIQDASDGQIGTVNDPEEWGDDGPTIAWEA